jgi:hypothetical protein
LTYLLIRFLFPIKNRFSRVQKASQSFDCNNVFHEEFPKLSERNILFYRYFGKGALIGSSDLRAFNLTQGFWIRRDRGTDNLSPSLGEQRFYTLPERDDNI